MEKIHKYPIDVTDIQKIQMPEGARILTAAMQGRNLMLWALVDPDAKLVDRTIEVFGTGHPMKAGSRDYITTFQLEDGSLIFHVFERSDQ